ncbi:MAG: RelA/SpoT domain-containing protein [Bradyrhizobiaceae bacterium]|nr:RelA/SpoT domain-containing protein [Bradyrhizobiaceae bacterium]
MIRIILKEAPKPAQLSGPGGFAPHDFTGLNVTDFPRFEYSMKDVLRAGEALAGAVPWNNEQEAETAREIFKIAHNFRDSHAYPMRRLRHELMGKIRSQGIGEGVTAARLKRMPSIRRKLKNHPGKLNQIQDLAGCRAVVPTIGEVKALIEALRNGSAHELFREYPYIYEAKPDGYRSHHMVFKFRGVGDEAVYDTRRVEIQIRTGLQHSWATAVEAVGLFRREDLKAGQGDPGWLRLFQLMSGEFALEEGCITIDANDHQKRVEEITALERKLDAVDTLERLSQAFTYAENYYFDPQNKPDYFKITYDRHAETVRIEPFFGPIYASLSYDAAEVKNAESGSSDTKIVLVEVDEIENLRTAYPNYFGDVQLFKSKLRGIAKPEEKPDYSVPPQQRVRVTKAKPDLSWLTGYRRWK